MPPRIHSPLEHLNANGQVISALLPYTGMILTVCCVLTFALRHYGFEPLARRFYRTKYTSLDNTQQRTFINHHVAGTVKLFLLVFTAYPFIEVVTGRRQVHEPYVHGSIITFGDMLVIVVQIFTAMYIFELIYRVTVSPISAAHHVGAIIIAQTGSIIGLDPAHRSDAEVEFLLCLLWGAFDVVAEFWPHLAMIIYRLFPDEHHHLKHVLLGTACLEVLGTVVETAIVMVIWGSLWNKWTISFKIVTPILHILFSFAQLWGARVFFQMYVKQKRLAAEQDRSEVTIEIEQESKA